MWRGVKLDPGSRASTASGVVHFVRSSNSTWDKLLLLTASCSGVHDDDAFHNTDMTPHTLIATAQR